MGDRDIKLLFGQRVRELRKKKAVSQEAFAASINLDRSYFGSVERGERNVSLENIAIIADGLGVEAFELLRFEAKAKAPTARPGKPRPTQSSQS
jgi:transcriptional regulator with XRE-family HTH domain